MIKQAGKMARFLKENKENQLKLSAFKHSKVCQRSNIEVLGGGPETMTSIYKKKVFFVVFVFFCVE